MQCIHLVYTCGLLTSLVSSKWEISTPSSPAYVITSAFQKQKSFGKKMNKETTHHAEQNFSTGSVFRRKKNS